MAAYSMAKQGYPLVMIIGILMVAGEYRHQTVTWAFLVNPRRSAFIMAKLVSSGGIGLATGLLAAVVTTPLVMILLVARNVPLFTDKVPLALAGSIGGTALWCVFGAAVAALMQR